MKKILLLLLLFTLTKYGISQNPRKEFPVGINGYLGGPGGIFGISIDAFVIPAINLEAGMGLSFDGKNYFGGVKYHTEAESNSNWSLFSGIIMTVAPYDDDSNPCKIKTKYGGLAYLPVGIQYISDRGFTFGFEFAGIIDKNLAIFDNHLMPWFGIKLGIHFSLKDDLPKPEKRKSTYRDESFEYHID